MLTNAVFFMVISAILFWIVAVVHFLHSGL